MRHRTFTRAALFLVIAVAMLCSPDAGRATPAPINVLFIGNSYTRFNDMPDMVSAMGRSLGYDIRPVVRTVGGMSLSYHQRSSETLRLIDSGGWDFVVLQDYSLDPGKRPDVVQKQSLPSVRFLAERIRSKNPSAKIVLYETWGRRYGDIVHCLSYPKVCTFDGHAEALRDGYRLYQAAIGGMIAPVGDNWQRIVHDDSGQRPFGPAELWLNDNSHPTRLGSYLAAATILRMLISSPVSSSGYAGGLPQGTAKYLRSTADGH